MAVFCPFIGRVARYTPSSRPKNASKTKANLEFHESSDDFDFYIMRIQKLMNIVLLNFQTLYGHENEMYNVGVNLKEVECL